MPMYSVRKSEKSTGPATQRDARPARTLIAPDLQQTKEPVDGRVGRA